jgi:hypothetical protein
MQSELNDWNEEKPHRVGWEPRTPRATLRPPATGGRRNVQTPCVRDQIEAMYKAFEQVRTRMQLSGAKAFPIVELAAQRSRPHPIAIEGSSGSLAPPMLPAIAPPDELLALNTEERARTALLIRKLGLVQQ